MDIIKKEITEDMIERAIVELPDGRAQVIEDLGIRGVPNGKIYATRGNGVYWMKKKSGLIEHEHRGKDKVPRPIAASKTLAARYYQQTGRRLDLEMEQEQLLVQMMFDTAALIEDPKERFTALKEATAAQSRFNKTWLPFLEQKLGTLQSSQTLEERQSLSDALEHYDETDGS